MAEHPENNPHIPAENRNDWRGQIGAYIVAIISILWALSSWNAGDLFLPSNASTIADLMTNFQLVPQLTNGTVHRNETDELSQLRTFGEFKVILGPKGVGKSRIALELANQLKSNKKNAILFVDYGKKGLGPKYPYYDLVTRFMLREPKYKEYDDFDIRNALEKVESRGLECVIIVDATNKAADDAAVMWVRIGKSMKQSPNHVHTFLFTSTGSGLKNMEFDSDYGMADQVYIPDMTKDQSFELLGNFGIKDDLVKQEIYDQVGGRPMHMEEFKDTDTAEARQAAYDKLWSSLKTDYGNLKIALDALGPEVNRADLKKCLPIMVNHFNKIKAEGKLNPIDRTFSRFHDIPCDDGTYPKQVAQAGNVFRLTSETEVAVDSIMMEKYLQDMHGVVDLLRTVRVAQEKCDVTDSCENNAIN